MNHKSIIFIYGPTGSGKTTLSYEIVKHFFSCNKLNSRNISNLIKKIYHNVEISHLSHDLTHENYVINGQGTPHETKPHTGGVIINMDSKQIYFHLSPLTASPSDKEKAITNHYLFNEYGPHDHLTVDIWYKKTIDFIENTRFDYYLIVGGSSFYLKYFLTNNGFNGQGQFHDLIEIFLKFYPWDSVMIMFSYGIQRFQPHINDEFRKYNFLKHYFYQRFGNHLLGYKSQDNHQQPSNNCLFIAHDNYNILIITLNPHVNLLESNIKTRSQGLPINSMEQEAQYLHSQYLVHKNFSSIIGYQQLINQWDSQRFHWDTFKYAKSQKKWINYFLKNSFFGYPYWYFYIYN